MVGGRDFAVCALLWNEKKKHYISLTIPNNIRR